MSTFRVCTILYIFLLKQILKKNTEFPLILCLFFKECFCPQMLEKTNYYLSIPIPMKKTIYRNPKNLNNAIAIVKFMISCSTKFIRMASTQNSGRLKYCIISAFVSRNHRIKHLAYAISHSLTA